MSPDIELKIWDGSEWIATDDGGTGVPENGVSRWEFEQDVTDSWDDNGATDNTSAGYTTDNVRGDYAKEFDGVDDRVIIPNSSNLDFSSDFTVTLWVNFDGISDTYPRLVSTSENGSIDVYYHTDDNEYKAYVGGDLVSSGVSKTNDEWTFLAVKSESGTGYIYVDNSTPASSSSVIPSSSTNDWYVGSTDVEKWFDGSIDDLRFYDSALPDSRIGDILNGDE